MLEKLPENIRIMIFKRLDLAISSPGWKAVLNSGFVLETTRS
jgi:hypothetical protein